MDFVLNLPLNERQGVYAKKSQCFFFLKGLRCRGENKTCTLHPVCIRETPVMGVRSFRTPPSPPTKSPRYGPAMCDEFTH